MRGRVLAVLAGLCVGAWSYALFLVLHPYSSTARHRHPNASGTAITDRDQHTVQHAHTDADANGDPNLYTFHDLNSN